MTKIHKIVNAETGEVIERPYTDEELLRDKARQEIIDAETLEINKRIAARQAILDRLGLTEDEAKLLLG